MKKLLLLLVLVLITIIIWALFIKTESLPINNEDRAQVSLMPLPSELNLKNGVFNIFPI